jgi:hypothetical protein
MTAFPDVIEKRELTSIAAPMQYEGQLRDGRRYYFRYRWGIASLGIGASRAEAIADPNTVSVQIGDELDGYLNADQFEEVASRLLAQRADRDSEASESGGRTSQVRPSARDESASAAAGEEA